MDTDLLVKPNTTPTAMPHKAECPIASEKNAIFLFTTKVPSNAKIGEEIRIARSALRMKAYSRKSITAHLLRILS